MNDHRKIHYNMRPFSCDTCGKSFTQQGNRDRHEKTCRVRKQRVDTGRNENVTQSQAQFARYEKFRTKRDHFYLTGQ